MNKGILILTKDAQHTVSTRDPFTEWSCPLALLLRVSVDEEGLAICAEDVPGLVAVGGHDARVCVMDVVGSQDGWGVDSTSVGLFIPPQWGGPYIEKGSGFAI